MSRKPQPITALEPKDIGRNVIFTGGLLPEQGALTKLIDEPPGHVMVSFGGCAAEPVPLDKLTWGKGRG